MLSSRVAAEQKAVGKAAEEAVIRIVSGFKYEGLGAGLLFRYRMLVIGTGLCSYT